MFNKKFKVRVVHFTSDKYSIEYAYYRFFPIWRELSWWFEPEGMLSGLEGWSPVLKEVEAAEKLAIGLKSMEDVKKWYEPQEEFRKEFYERKERYLKNKIPYDKKEF